MTDSIMPYIPQQDRDLIDKPVNVFIDSLRKFVLDKEGKLNKGRLNYVLSRIIWHLFSQNRSYTRGSDLRGVIADVDSEFYRRKVAPYEDEKIKENGDLDD